MSKITIEEINGVNVLRDDLLPGGTKSILLDSMLDNTSHYVYASPVYGGFQIALAAKIGPRATIFCAKRRIMHPNTRKCLDLGAGVVEVEHGYLSVVEKAARDFCDETKSVKLAFGARSEENIDKIAERMRSVTERLGYEPEQIWCAVGSGTLIEGIIKGTDKAQINGVVVGKDYDYKRVHDDIGRVRIFKHHQKFEAMSRAEQLFPSMPNYDLKAWEYCMVYGNENKSRLFWNVL